MGHELAERIEHAAGHGHGHGHGHGPAVGKLSGITVAILGVLLALCSALLGGERTEVIATMVEQSNTLERVQSLSVKYRTTLAELATLHALSPSQRELRHFQETLAKMKADASKIDARETLQVDALGESTRALSLMLQPKRSDMERTLASAKRYAESSR
jgi:hypothetical protein